MLGLSHGKLSAAYANCGVNVWQNYHLNSLISTVIHHVVHVDNDDQVENVNLVDQFDLFDMLNKLALLTM